MKMICLLSQSVEAEPICFQLVALQKTTKGPIKQVTVEDKGVCCTNIQVEDIRCTVPEICMSAASERP